MLIVLSGLPATGKTTIARELAGDGRLACRGKTAEDDEHGASLVEGTARSILSDGGVLHSGHGQSSADDVKRCGGRGDRQGEERGCEAPTESDGLNLRHDEHEKEGSAQQCDTRGVDAVGSEEPSPPAQLNTRVVRVGIDTRRLDRRQRVAFYDPTPVTHSSARLPDLRARLDAPGRTHQRV